MDTHSRKFFFRLACYLSLGLLFFAFAIAACKESIPVFPKGKKAAYYWKTTWEEGSIELAKKYHLERLYVRYFDIVGRGHGQFPIPNAMLQAAPTDVHELDIVPVVFILNDVWRQLDSAQTDSLASKTVDLVQQLHGEMALRELQLDSDWTEGTAKAYFRYLEALKRALPHVSISCTLRLWQYKDRITSGVPPVDRVALMVYNLQSPSDAAIENSILDIETAASYLKGISKYPISMDVILPIFQWGIHFRKGKVQGIQPKWAQISLKELSFLKPSKSNTYTILQDTFFLNTSLQKGDVLRIESVTPAELSQIKSWLAPNVSTSNTFYEAFYHLDSTSIHTFGESYIFNW